MVTADVRRSARGVTETLEELNPLAIATMAAGAIGGLALAQEVADLALPMLGFTAGTTSPTGLGASALVKLGGAVLAAMVGSYFGGGVAWASGLVAFGMVASMGLDLLDMAQEGGIPGSTPSTPSLSSPTPSSSPSPPPSPEGPSANIRRASASSGGAGNYR